MKTLLAVLVVASAAPAAEVAGCRLVAGWVQDGASRVFGADNLYEYLDGEAEGYLIYGFVRLHNTTCAKDEGTIVLDISEMIDSDAAYGIFTAHRNPGQSVLPIGMGGQVLPQLAIFAKDKYYIRIATNSDRDAREVLKAYATEMEKRIEGRSAPPETVSWFPQEKLVSIRLIPESVLGLSALRRGYVAQYKEGKAFIVEEESAKSASSVLEKLRGRFGKTARVDLADEGFQGKDRYLGGICFFRKGRHIGGYVNLPEPPSAANLAQALASRIP